MAKNLLENPLSNSQISKSQQSILNRAYSEKVASLNRILWLIEPYPYHPRNFDCLPLENILSNSIVTNETSMYVCVCV